MNGSGDYFQIGFAPDDDEVLKRRDLARCEAQFPFV